MLMIRNIFIRECVSSKDACMVKPTLKVVPQQLLIFKLTLFSGLASAGKEQKIQNKAVEEMV